MNPVVLLAALSLAAPPDAVAPGSVPQPPREATRIRAGIGLSGMGGLSGSAYGFGVGLLGELGATFADRLSVTVRATFGTVIFATVLSAGLGVDYALSDMFGLGVGAAVTGLTGLDAPGALAATVPLRVTFAPLPRRAEQADRSGLLVTGELAPGITFASTGGLRHVVPPAPGFCITATLAISYATW